MIVASQHPSLGYRSHTVRSILKLCSFQLTYMGQDFATFPGPFRPNRKLPG